MLLYDIEKERFEKVFRKLAFGHLAYENDTLAWDSPYSIDIHLLSEMSDSQRDDFFVLILIEVNYCQKCAVMAWNT